MATNVNARRMGESSASIPQFPFEEWVPLPRMMLIRFPELREWNEEMRVRFEAVQYKLADYIAKVQAAERSGTGSGTDGG